MEFSKFEVNPTRDLEHFEKNHGVYIELLPVEIFAVGYSIVIDE